MAHAIGHLTRVASPARWRGQTAAFLRSAGLLAVLGAVAIAGAQTPREHVIHFTVFAPRQIADVGFVPKANAPLETLKFYPTARSPRYEYRGGMPLRFVDAKSGAVVAEATIPPNITDALLLFSAADTEGRASSGGLRYQIAVLDDSFARHSAGGLVILNLSGLSLSGVVNKENVTLKPGLNPPLAVGGSAKVTLHTNVKGKAYRAYADTVQLGRNQRALLILFPPFYKGSLEVQSRLLIDAPAGTTAGPAAKRAEK